MKCLLCSKEYINLGVHLRRKHHTGAADYKEQFGMLKTATICDPWLSKRMRESANQRLIGDPNWLAELRERCRANSVGRTGLPAAEFSQAAKDKLADRNRKNHADRLNRLAPLVEKILREKKTLADVKRDIGMSASAVKKIVAHGGAEYSKKAAAIIGSERQVLSRAKNKEIRNGN